MSKTVKLAEYLFTRLRQLGVDAMHGVPGDFNLTLLDYVEPAGMLWVGNANELNAGYAADGYARVKGIGAIITTFGVGELSAINAIAGSYAERAAVVHIVGTPQRDYQDSRRLVHHTFNDGEYGRFAKMHAEVTIDQESLRDPRTCPEQIDKVLLSCLIHSRPVYIEVPVDLVAAQVLAERLQNKLRIPDAVPRPDHEIVVKEILNRIYAAKQPTILVDGESRALGIVDDVREIVKLTQWPTWTTPFGKDVVDETTANFHGVYRGYYEEPKVKEFVDTSDLILCFGPHFSTTNSYNSTSIPSVDSAILFRNTEIKIGSQTYRDIPVKHALSLLLQNLDSSKVRKYNPYPDLPRDYSVPYSDLSPEQPITQDKIWRHFGNFLRPGDLVLGETGSAAYGVRDIPLPPHARLFTAVTWLSIGYMLPATQGAALAQRELAEASQYHGVKDPRAVLFIGDGSFQMTVQELGTIIRLNLNLVLFLINNDGYTIERCIHGVDQKYNDVARWRYLEAPSFFGASDDTYTASVKTWSELNKVLGSKEITDGKGLRMVEIVLGREDFVPGQLLDMLVRQRENAKSA